MSEDKTLIKAVEELTEQIRLLNRLLEGRSANITLSVSEDITPEQVTSGTKRFLQTHR